MSTSKKKTSSRDAGIPLIITKVMDRQLRALGYLKADIDTMTPAEAWRLIQANEKKGSRPSPPPSAPDAAERLSKLKDKTDGDPKAEKEPEPEPTPNPAAEDGQCFPGRLVTAADITEARRRKYTGTITLANIWCGLHLLPAPGHLLGVDGRCGIGRSPSAVAAKDRGDKADIRDNPHRPNETNAQEIGRYPARKTWWDTALKFATGRQSKEAREQDMRHRDQCSGPRECPNVACRVPPLGLLKTWRQTMRVKALRDHLGRCDKEAEPCDHRVHSPDVQDGKISVAVPARRKDGSRIKGRFAYVWKNLEPDDLEHLRVCPKKADGCNDPSHCCEPRPIDPLLLYCCKVRCYPLTDPRSRSECVSIPGRIRKNKEKLVAWWGTDAFGRSRPEYVIDKDGTRTKVADADFESYDNAGAVVTMDFTKNPDGTNRYWGLGGLQVKDG